MDSLYWTFDEREDHFHNVDVIERMRGGKVQEMWRYKDTDAFIERIPKSGGGVRYRAMSPASGMPVFTIGDTFEEVKQDMDEHLKEVLG